MKQPRAKIALVGEILSRGGAEKVQARLSFFFEAQDIEVHHIIVRDEITYHYAGVMFNMGKLKNKSNGIFNKYKRFRALKDYLNENRFDFIVDFRVKNNFLQEYFIANKVYKSPYIMSIRSFETSYYFPKNLFLAKRIFRKAFGFVTVSKALEEKITKIYDCKNVKTIYNPIDISEISSLAKAPIDLDFRYFLGIGRMSDNIKQFDHLINAFNNSEAKTNGIKLILIGDGAFKNELEKLVKQIEIEDAVVFIPYTENPFPYYKNAIATVLTSKNEGFPNVLIESLAAGTPVISYDCESGPREIIDDRSNGLLVANQDISAITTAIDLMINDSDLYNNCKANAEKSISHLTLDKIGNYNESISYSEDVDFNIRANAKFKMAYYNEPLVVYTFDSENQITQKSIKGKVVPDFDYYEKMFPDRTDIKKYLDFHRYIKAKLFKLSDDTEGYSKMIRNLDFENLTKTQRFLVKSPRFILVLVKKLKYAFLKLGIDINSY
jgi:N-acetylgalactosamine-N,N'-diacetylbacillosaminyl-diphospho-undecaprenol 4-alpha-N-acetylgalactosaminyltransferase